MKVKLDSTIDPQDMPAVNLSLLHAAKKSAAEGYEAKNAIERKLMILSETLFTTYLDSLKSEVMDILENNK